MVSAVLEGVMHARICATGHILTACSASYAQYMSIVYHAVASFDDCCTAACDVCVFCMQPKNYLDFLSNYKKALAGNRTEISEMTNRLSTGLQKLIQAAAEVDSMQKELSQAKVVVEAATQECNELLEVGDSKDLMQDLTATGKLASCCMIRCCIAPQYH